MGCNIAIDGPAGAGKSTIAKKVAKELSFIYVDTGAMYRAMALYLLNHGVNGENQEEIEAVCSGGNMASKSSANPKVRAHLLKLQRTLAEKNDVVMDGRDIGTTILPNAEVKIYLTASADTRAKRRALEYEQKGESFDLDQIRKDIIERDERDMNREISPLKQADDAVLVDSSEMGIDDVVSAILNVYKEKVQK